MNLRDIYGYFHPEKRRTPFTPITPAHKVSIDAARAWIRSQDFARTPRTRRGTDSYKLKHTMQYSSGLYVLNGIFIQAMIEEGFIAKCNGEYSPNANFNIDPKTIRRTHELKNAVPQVTEEEFLARFQ